MEDTKRENGLRARNINVYIICISIRIPFMVPEAGNTT